MSDENSIFLCNACDERLRGRRVAYRHIEEGYGLKIEGKPEQVKYLEKKFLTEINII